LIASTRRTPKAARTATRVSSAQAYFEHPDYVPTTGRELPIVAFSRRTLRQASLSRSRPYRNRTARRHCRPRVLRGLAAEHNLTVHNLSPKEIVARWPGPSCRRRMLPAYLSRRPDICSSKIALQRHLSAAEAAGATLDDRHPRSTRGPQPSAKSACKPIAATSSQNDW